MIPGPKVGLVIGKGGETIKHLQDTTGARMVVVQDSNSQDYEKPLRITGTQQQVDVSILPNFNFVFRKKSFNNYYYYYFFKF